MKNVSSIKAAPVKAAPVKAASMDALKAQAVKGIAPVKASKADIIATTKAALENTQAKTLSADVKLATAYVTAVTKADKAVQGAELAFCKGFAHNHEGQLPKAIKAGFKALKAANAFEGLSNQTIDNLSSMSQYIAALPYAEQDAIFEADNFRKAYQLSRWPATGKQTTPATEEVEEVESVATAPREKATHAPVSPATFDGACNDIAIALNGVIEQIAETYKAFASNPNAFILEALARDIGDAIEKAAHARLATSEKVKQAA